MSFGEMKEPIRKKKRPHSANFIYELFKIHARKWVLRLFTNEFVGNFRVMWSLAIALTERSAYFFKIS